MANPARMIHRPMRMATIGSNTGRPRLAATTPARTAAEISTSLRWSAADARSAVLPVRVATERATRCMPSLITMTATTSTMGRMPGSTPAPPEIRRVTDWVMTSKPTMPVKMATMSPAIGWARWWPKGCSASALAVGGADADEHDRGSDDVRERVQRVGDDRDAVERQADHDLPAEEDRVAHDAHPDGEPLRPVQGVFFHPSHPTPGPVGRQPYSWNTRPFHATKAPREPRCTGTVPPKPWTAATSSTSSSSD